MEKTTSRKTMDVEPLEMYTMYDPVILETAQTLTSILDTKSTPVIDEPKSSTSIDTVPNDEDNSTILCHACNRLFAHESSLERHFERSPVCMQWYNLDESTKTKHAIFTRTTNISILDFIDDMKKKITATHTKESLYCKYCHVGFSNVGNLNKHFKTAVTCNRFAYIAFHDELKNVEILI